MPVLPRTFYARGAEEVARSLLGAVLVQARGGTFRRARITETEAYVGPHDLASHARAGKTRRNAAMWGPPGRAYVYFTYGMHHMLNVVCAGEGDAQAVLVRAAEPLDDWEARLTGPALLAKGFGLDLAHDGADLVRGPLRIHRGPTPPAILVDRRVGVDYAGTWADAPLRFLDAAGPVSRGLQPPLATERSKGRGHETGTRHGRPRAPSPPTGRL